MEEMDVSDLYKILRLRQQVFVVEQNCAYLDLDNRDQGGHHLSGWITTDECIPVAYLRLLPENNSVIRIGRVVTHPDYRRTGLGRELLTRGLASIKKCWDSAEIRLSAQHYLVHFYEEFGFTSCSEIFLEDGIPHVEMIRSSTRMAS